MTKPVHVPLEVAGVPRTRLAGRVSTKSEARVNTVVLGFPSVIVSVELAPKLMVEGLKSLSTVGGVGWLTPSVATAGFGLLPALVCNWPAAMMLVCPPDTAEVTSTSMVQPPAGILAPLA